jgi:hypothetical protein
MQMLLLQTNKTRGKEQMKHDELLLLLKEEAKSAVFRMDRNAWLTLSDIVELHKPFTVKDEVLCEGCCQHVYLTDYPCPTIQAIKEQLK